MTNATTFSNYLILQERLAAHQRDQRMAQTLEENLRKDMERLWTMLTEEERIEARRIGSKMSG